MKELKRKGFTLIELIAVLVIMAILALIVTPLVMNIIRSARSAADKRSVDAYGRSIELAMASYLLDTGRFPTQISDLTIEYSGNEVVCVTTKLNSDSSVYLAGCTVNGRSTGNYTYGSSLTPSTPTYTAYSVGDEVTYNGVNYYVIENSGLSDSTVTMLKADPLTAEEITTYSAGTGAQIDGNGGMQYHSSSNNYATSFVKTTVDAWKNAKAPAASEARLITLNDLATNFGYILDELATTERYIPSSTTPAWVYNSNYYYWTSTPYNDSSSSVFLVCVDKLESNGVYHLHTGYGFVRPVITISKSAL